MDEYIRRQDVVTALIDAISNRDNWYTAVKNIPAADVEKVVRCRNCKYVFYKKDAGVYFCHRFNDHRRTSGEKYCSYGEEK